MSVPLGGVAGFAFRTFFIDTKTVMLLVFNVSVKDQAVRMNRQIRKYLNHTLW